MSSAAPHRIYQGVVNAPPPPLAGGLAAWLTSQGHEVRVIDPRGGHEDWSGAGPLWVHLEGDVLERCRERIPSHDKPTFFGPGAAAAAASFPEARVITGEPEGEAVDPSSLPITTYAGFGPQPGGLFRVLAGRYGVAKPLARLLSEVVYLVETHSAGHLLFDDEDLDRYGNFMSEVEAELRQLPWILTWEGSASGQRIRSTRGAHRARL